jgi:LysM repeat protein
MKLKFIILFVFSIFAPILTLPGQKYSPPTRMPGGAGASQASLTQDVALLKEQLGEMRFEVERLLRENESLELRMKKVEAQSSAGVSDLVFRQELASLRAEFNRLNKTQQEEILSQISKQIKVLAKETEKSLESVASGGGVSQGSPIITKFNDNYPKSGIYYMVKSGDTISKIANSVGSTITHIIHANQITDPDRLQVGEELFIPIDNP